MKLRKGHKLPIYTAAFSSLLFLVALFVYVTAFKGTKQREEALEMLREAKEVRISRTEALDQVREFCKRLGLQCVGEPFIETCFPLGEIYSRRYEYNSRHCFGGGSYKPFGVIVAMDDMTAVREGAAKDPNIHNAYIFIVVGGKSKEVEFYQNMAIYDFYRLKKYRSMKWPDFMPEEKARKIFDSIVAKLRMPEDMFFERMEKDEGYHTWNAYLLRKKDGYWYEGDAVTISIMGPTGEFIAYTKTYRGIPVPTEVKIGREQALELAFGKLREDCPWKVKEKVREIYRLERAELLIMQKDILRRSSIPVRVDGSRLAWVFEFYFTGGIAYHGPPIEKPMDLFTKEERKAYEAYLNEKREKWGSMWRPPLHFEVRIDAATGEFVYISKVPHWFWKWFAKRES